MRSPPKRLMRCQHKSGWKLHPDKVDHDEMRREGERGGNQPTQRQTDNVHFGRRQNYAGREIGETLLSFFLLGHRASCMYLLTLHEPRWNKGHIGMNADDGGNGWNIVAAVASHSRYRRRWLPSVVRVGDSIADVAHRGP